MNHNSLSQTLMWDAFKAQSNTKVEDTLASYGIKTVMAPNNMTGITDAIHETCTQQVHIINSNLFT